MLNAPLRDDVILISFLPLKKCLENLLHNSFLVITAFLPWCFVKKSTIMNQLGLKTNIWTKILTTPQYSSRRLPIILSRCLKREASSQSGKKESGEEFVAEKFTESGAAKWKSFDTFSVPQASQYEARPRAEPYVISISISIFLIYFLCLREENDLDLDLDKPLYERIPTLERAQIKAQIRKNEREGLDTSDLQLRLQQLNIKIKQRQQ